MSQYRLHWLYSENKGTLSKVLKLHFACWKKIHLWLIFLKFKIQNVISIGECYKKKVTQKKYNCDIFYPEKIRKKKIYQAFGSTVHSTKPRIPVIKTIDNMTKKDERQQKTEVIDKWNVIEHACDFAGNSEKEKNTRKENEHNKKIATTREDICSWIQEHVKDQNDGRTANRQSTELVENRDEEKKRIRKGITNGSDC